MFVKAFEFRSGFIIPVRGSGYVQCTDLFKVGQGVGFDPAGRKGVEGIADVEDALYVFIAVVPVLPALR